MCCTGKEVRQVRLASQTKSHGEFTKWVYSKTGVLITNHQLAQIENYGIDKACSPRKPPRELALLVRSYLDNGSSGI